MAESMDEYVLVVILFEVQVGRLQGVLTVQRGRGSGLDGDEVLQQASL